jgi:CspA family cold shock protein
MSLIAKLCISFVITAIATAICTMMLDGAPVQFFDLRIAIAFFASTTATAIIVGAITAQSQTNPDIVATSPSSDTGQRDQGTVKWFNVSKGFGFIVKEDGEEIFVHFRSIRGEGRRSLRDGEAVNFITTDSEKGPQAEDVVAER